MARQQRTAILGERESGMRRDGGEGYEAELGMTTRR